MWGAIATGVIGAISASNSASAAGKAAGLQGEAASAAAALAKDQATQARSDNKPYAAIGTSATNRLNYLMGFSPYDKNAALDAWQKYNGVNLADQPPGWSPSNLDQFVAEHPQVAPTTNSGDLTRSFTTADLNADPVYKAATDFGIQQGTQGINNAALANGSYDSGATLKALTRFATNYGGTQAAGAQSRFTQGQQQQYGMLSGQQAVGQNANNANAGISSNSTAAQGNYGTQAANAGAAGVVGGANAWSGLGTSVGNAYNQYQSNQTLQALLAQNQPNAGGYQQGVDYFRSQL